MRSLLLGIIFLLGFNSSVLAINIKIAEVQNGVAVVRGNKAASNADIFWEGAKVTRANKGGNFSFSGVVPSDCIGTLSDGTPIEVVVLNCTPVLPTPGRALVPQTGQVLCYDTVGAVINCSGTGQDGELRKGVPWPDPRFTDNANGTITDNLTGLIWLKNANCPGGTRAWATALSDVASLNTGGTMNGNVCGDISNGGTNQTDWRLPNIRELFSLVDFAFINPAISNAAGTGQGSVSDPFSNFLAAPPARRVWSSTSFAGSGDTETAWYVDFGNGTAGANLKTEVNDYYVFAVRGGS